MTSVEIIPHICCRSNRTGSSEMAAGLERGAAAGLGLGADVGNAARVMGGSPSIQFGFQCLNFCQLLTSGRFRLRFLQIFLRVNWALQLNKYLSQMDH